MRLSGLLIPIDSLPNNTGISTLSDCVRFVRFLKKAKQSYWQIAPLVLTDSAKGNKPSVFALDINLIDVEKLSEIGLLTDQDVLSFSRTEKSDKQYFAQRQTALHTAFENFYRETPPQEFNQFIFDNKYWLDDFALYSALKTHFEGLPWYNWPDDIRNRTDEAVIRYTELLSKSIEYHRFCQYQFWIQWQNVKKFLCDNGIKLIGEIPVFVDYDSADVWAHRQLFLLKTGGVPRRKVILQSDNEHIVDEGTTHVPFNWQAMRQDGYDWWRQRISQCADMYSAVVIDNFYALSASYAVPFDKPNSSRGVWLKGAGKSIVDLFRTVAPELQLIAGLSVPRKKSLANFASFCGVMNSKSMQQVLPKTRRGAMFNTDKNTVAYVCTNFVNDSAYHWWTKASWFSRRRLRKYLNVTAKTDINWQIIGTLAVSDAQICIIAMQDLIQWGLNRNNTDNTVFCDSDFSNACAKRLAQLTEKAYRSLQTSNDDCATDK